MAVLSAKTQQHHWGEIDSILPFQSNNAMFQPMFDLAIETSLTKELFLEHRMKAGTFPVHKQIAVLRVPYL